LFEEYRFRSVLRTHAGDLVTYKNKVEHPGEHCCLVVDAGFSFTHVVPYINGRQVKEAAARIDVGGKLLTNHLKEIVSYRQLHVLDETHVMNACKEDCCYVSMDFDADMKAASLRGRASNTVAVDYVLPDFTALRRGFARPNAESSGRPQTDGEQIVRMNNERFQVPELLFHPSDIGIQQMGIPECIAHVIGQCPEEARRWLYRNIVLVGGCANLRNFRARVERDVRSEAPSHYDVVVRLPEDPVGYAWRGGAALAGDACFPSLCVTRQEYLERGHQACADKYFL